MELLDALSVYLGRLIAVLSVICAGVLGVALLCELLCDGLLRRAGMMGMVAAFARAEFQKDPRGFAARLFWGAKES